MPLKNTAAFITLLTLGFADAAFGIAKAGPYDPSENHPYGRPNPEQKDAEARVFDQFIGTYNCTQKRTNPQTKQITESEATWTWEYDMNGYAVRDKFRYGEAAPVSQRFYNPSTKQWHVWYFLGQQFYYAGEWIGGGKDDRLIFEQKYKDADGEETLSRLEFFNITDTSYNWHSTNIIEKTGEISIDWEIACKR
ncbi:hypothetical protein [Kordiimonas aquimaris]|uniref:hypothetical protein n=1 Tax=Kordiimonas aquimaris TaxID=707591 RepID=UPI0021D1798C|nr:hypothetical protein [Kordiimonas aquimaris]